MILRAEDPHKVRIGDTPIISVRFLLEDERYVRDLSGYNGFITFWYPDATPHLRRDSLVLGPTGTVRYRCRGDEFNRIGEIRFQATIYSPDLADGDGRAFFEHSSKEIRWDVLGASA